MDQVASEPIRRVVVMALATGNTISEVSDGWSKVKQVVIMGKPLETAVRQAASEDPSLRYWRTAPNPHSAAEEGFTDDEAHISLAFPLAAQ